MDIKNKIYDKEFRDNLLSNPKKYYKEFGNNLLDGIEVVVKENSKSKYYIVMPNDSTLSIDSLDKVQAAYSVGTALCAGTLGTGFSCVSTLGTLTSAGCASTS